MNDTDTASPLWGHTTPGLNLTTSTGNTDELNERFASAILPLTITFGVFAVTGVAGNIIVLIVFSLGRAYRNNNFRVFVVCLGLIDLLTSAFLIPAEMAKHRNYFGFENVVMCKLKNMLNVWAGSAAALSLLVISVDRYRKVCQPFKRQISPRLALRLCVVLSFLVPIVLAVPGVIMSGIRQAHMLNERGQNTTVYICSTEEKFQKHPMRVIYKYTFITLLLGVSIACIVMYILIGKQIFSHWGSLPVSFRKDSNREYNSEYSSDTFGNLKVVPQSTNKSANNETSNRVSTETKSSDVDPCPPSPIVCPGSAKTASESPRRTRAQLVKQSTLDEGDKEAMQKKFIRQLSSVSASSGRIVVVNNDTSSSTASRRRTMSRRASGFGLKRFPYKTLIWFVLTLVFIVTYILFLAMATKVDNITKLSPSSFALFEAFFRLYFLNNIINPLVYALLDKNFRKACRTIGPRLKYTWRECWQ
ncbi:alpha-2C adrenergic receptor-like isoform X3 [Dreissena polymorpha]|uniref:alpha-2C adrenergic receptor-like isoform X3 n=1 Tax=Dreissena polymorpha TaxID=45954 RepID=UPI002264EDBA|nr:alpha-2C adrenergic receptor-like isoform X3 [Dreissena polymorpha]